MLSGAVGAMFLATLSARAADLPAAPANKAPGFTSTQAVDGINVKFDGFGGTIAKKGFGAGRGVLTVPLGTSLGFQVDALGGTYDGNAFETVAGHLFWRNPSFAMLGLYADQSYLDKAGGVQAQHVGGEGALFLGRWTLGGRAGVEFGNSTSEIVGNMIETYDVKTRFFDKADLSYYLTDDLKLSIGHRYLGGRNAAALGAEWGFTLPSNAMGALFVETTLGDSDATGVWGGLRIYLGQHQKSLMARNRQDDPDPVTPENLLTITNSLSTSSIPTAAPHTPLPE
jgi:hypothetical protein